MVIGRADFGAVRVAWTDASLHDLVPADVLAELGAPQMRRYEALSGAVARRFLVGRWLLSGQIAELTDAKSWGFTTTCRRCGADHGQPRLEAAPVAVSVSYAGDVVAVAAVPCADAAAVGVDIEQVSAAQGPMRDLAPLFAPAEPPGLEEWTLIEAALKADGRGLTVDLAQVEVGPRGSGRSAGAHAVRLPGRSVNVDAAVIAGPSGFILSAATVPAEAGARHPS